MKFEERARQELTGVLRHYASGNAEIVRTYFSRPRTREQDLAWIKRQAARELTTAWKFLDNLVEFRPKFEREIRRRSYESLARSFLEEIEHYRLFVELLEEEFQEKIVPEELLAYGVWSEDEGLPENAKKARFERALRTSGNELAKIALGIGEGGGSGWLIAGSRIRGGRLEERIARVMGEVAADEMYHGPIHIAAAARRIRTEEELWTVRAILWEYLRHHLRMKNEQFGYPLSEERLAEIDAGQVEPLEGVDFSPVEHNRGEMAHYAL
ncbi:MAG: hypothetical protein HYY85_17790 [Deltaproteobacteria bacterium]|nr:hypothetical protein [Deltaproteobacteria bacterium]